MKNSPAVKLDIQFELHHILSHMADPYKNCSPEMRHDRTGAIMVDVFVALSNVQVHKYTYYIRYNTGKGRPSESIKSTQFGTSALGESTVWRALTSRLRTLPKFNCSMQSSLCEAFQLPTTVLLPPSRWISFRLRLYVWFWNSESVLATRLVVSSLLMPIDFAKIIRFHNESLLKIKTFFRKNEQNFSTQTIVSLQTEVHKI